MRMQNSFFHRKSIVTPAHLNIMAFALCLGTLLKCTAIGSSSNNLGSHRCTLRWSSFAATRSLMYHSTSVRAIPRTFLRRHKGAVEFLISHSLRSCGWLSLTPRWSWSRGSRCQIFQRKLHHTILHKRIHKIGLPLQGLAAATQANPL